MKKPSAHVFVLGSINRSPRTLAHARYLAANGWSVTVSAYLDHTESGSEYANLKLLPVPMCADFTKYLYPKIFAFILKFFVLTFTLMWHVACYCRSSIVLLQNPPAVPTFLVLFVFTRLTGKKLIIDWHNYGYTLMELNTKPNSICSKVYQQLEVDFARWFLADGDYVQHICVSEAFRQDLLKRGIVATVFYDRPPEHFRPTIPEVAHELFCRLRSQYSALADPAGSKRRTRLTEITALPTDCGGSFPQWRPDRPALVVSSCSWTPDDDFELILTALAQYDVQAARDKDSTLPHILFVVTGRGPLKSYYADRIRQQQWSHVEVLMPWLDSPDYPVFLGCADLGISVHRSSSGLDLPMKVVDLVGVEVPVVALAYPTLDELLKPPDRGGFQFTDAAQLAKLLCDLLRTELPRRSHSPNTTTPRLGSPKLAACRDAWREHNERTPRARPYWDQVVLPLFQRAL